MKLKFLKTEIKSYSGKNTDFYDKKWPEAGSSHT